MKRLFIALALLASAAFAQSAPPPVNIGSKVVFSVTADGTTPFTYQWRKNALPIPGATGVTYTIASAVQSDAGPYTCLVSNSAGSALSDESFLSFVVVAPSNVRATQTATTSVTGASTPAAVK